MSSRWKLIFLAGLLLLGTSSVFLSACSFLGGKSTSDVDSRIAKLESDVKANGEAITKLQQQAQAQQLKVDALTPAPAAPVTPVAPVTPAAPTPTAAPSVIPTALVKLDKLTITPTAPNLGQTVTISIEVTNTSANEGSYRVTLVEKAVPASSSNVLEYANLVTLKPGETKVVTFTTSKTVVGTFSIESINQSAQYTVIDPNAPTS